MTDTAEHSDAAAGERSGSSRSTIVVAIIGAVATVASSVVTAVLTHSGSDSTSGGTPTAPPPNPVVNAALLDPATQCVQWALQADGESGVTADGVYGQQTKNAIQTFQQKYKLLPADGVVRVQTGSLIVALDRQHGHGDCADVVPHS